MKFDELYESLIDEAKAVSKGSILKGLGNFIKGKPKAIPAGRPISKPPVMSSKPKRAVSTDFKASDVKIGKSRPIHPDLPEKPLDILKRRPERSTMNDRDFEYHLMQRIGKNNSMGKFKVIDPKTGNIGYTAEMLRDFDKLRESLMEKFIGPKRNPNEVPKEIEHLLKPSPYGSMDDIIAAAGRNKAARQEARKEYYKPRNIIGNTLIKTGEWITPTTHTRNLAKKFPNKLGTFKAGGTGDNVMKGIDTATMAVNAAGLTRGAIKTGIKHGPKIASAVKKYTPAPVKTTFNKAKRFAKKNPIKAAGVGFAGSVPVTSTIASGKDK